tara:strand:+ start:177 stop:326 length:150 start_codon:yes stop_codon:yes gene_type:complete
MKYRVRYTDKTDYSKEIIVEAPDVRSALDEALEQLPDHIVILSALQTNL